MGYVLRAENERALSLQTLTSVMRNDACFGTALPDFGHANLKIMDGTKERRYES
jgi:hypothetical protein